MQTVIKANPPEAMKHGNDSRYHRVETVITYLEMRDMPDRGELVPPAHQASIVRAVRPTVSFYRYLYNTIGERWLWVDRRKLGDDELRAIIHDPRVEVFVLYVDGVPAGYAELDGRIEPDVEIVYLGLLPEFIGRGLGRSLLDWTIATAWKRGHERVWLHTCNFDHPGALRFYLDAGFVIYKRESKWIGDPRIELKPTHGIAPQE